MESDNKNIFDLTDRPSIKKHAFIFVCQKGKLEAFSCMLAASLKKFVKVDYEMIAVVPGPESFFGRPSDLSMNFLKKLGCKFFYFENEFVKEGRKDSHYLRANKIFAINVETNADKIILLDSDQLCCEDFFGDSDFFIPVAACLANHLSSKSFAENLPEIYSTTGIEIPKIRFKMPYAGIFSKFSKNEKEIYLPPHFYGGFLAVDSALAKELSLAWMENFKKVIDMKFLSSMYFAEEISLSLAIHKMQTPFLVLDLDWKYRRFLNYSAIENIKRNLSFLNVAKEILLEHPEIKSLVESDSTWRNILNFPENKFFSESLNRPAVVEPSNNALKPWMTDIEINLIKSFLQKDKIVLEWGTGGSTIEFSKYVKEYYSIEHNFEWYNAVSKRIDKNTHLFYIPPNTKNLNWLPEFEEGGYDDFKNYIKFVNIVAFAGKKFDLVLIDGRARADCAIEVLPHLSENAVVFIHNFERPYYWKVLKYYEIISVSEKLAALKIKKETFNGDRLFLIKNFLTSKLQSYV